MPRPISRSVARRLQAQGKIKYHCIVDWNNVKHTIWRDDDGPIYSTPATDAELRDAGIRDTIVMHPLFDTITYKIMQEDAASNNDRMPGGERLLA
jgi:hypothetical protein